MLTETTEQPFSPDIRVSYAALLSRFRPDRWLWAKNKWYVGFADNAGYEGKTEAWMTRGAAKDVLSMGDMEVMMLTRKSVLSLHANPEPDATWWKVLVSQKTKKGSVWGGPYAAANLAFADDDVARKAIARIQKLSENLVSIVTYPHILDGLKPYGTYAPGTELVETHPEAFPTADQWSVRDYVAAVQNGLFGGVCVDSHHFFGKTTSGKQPFKQWRSSFGQLLEAGVVEEFHFQPGRNQRVVEEDKKTSFQALKEIANGTIQHQELAEMVSMFNEYNLKRQEQGRPMAPIVVEITLESLVEAGVLSLGSLFSYEGLAQTHRKIIGSLKSH